MVVSITKTGASCKKCKNPNCSVEMPNACRTCPGCRQPQRRIPTITKKRKEKIKKSKRLTKKDKKIQNLEKFFRPEKFVESSEITVSKVVELVQNDELLLSHDTQRQVGQWSNKYKSELLLTAFETGSIVSSITIRRVKESIAAERIRQESMDGSHRVWTLHQFTTNQFKLSSGSQIYNNNRYFDVGGLYYADFPEQLRKYLANTIIPVQYISEYMPLHLIPRLFHRLQNGKKLRPIELAMTSHDLNAKYLRDFHNNELFTTVFQDTVTKNVSNLYTWKLAATTLFAAYSPHNLSPNDMVTFYLKNNIEQDSKETKIANNLCKILHNILRNFGHRLVKTREGFVEWDYRTLLFTIHNLLMEDYSIKVDDCNQIFNVAVGYLADIKNKSSHTQIKKHVKTLTSEIKHKIKLKKTYAV